MKLELITEATINRYSIIISRKQPPGSVICKKKSVIIFPPVFLKFFYEMLIIEILMALKVLINARTNQCNGRNV